MLEWSGFRPAILRGQHSLEVFCVGVFLAFVAHFLLILNGSLAVQFLVSFGGIALLIALAYFKEWSSKLDKKLPRMADDGVTPLHKVGPSILTRPPREKTTHRPELGQPY